MAGSSTLDRYKEGQKGIVLEHPSNSEANREDFHKEGSNSVRFSVSESILLDKARKTTAENACWVWQVGDHVGREREQCQWSGENSKFRSE